MFCQRLSRKDVVRWARQRKRGWNEQADLIGNDWPPRVAQDNKPNTN